MADLKLTLRHRDPTHKYLRAILRVAKGDFWPVFGTATLPTSTSEPSSRGEGGFWPVFGTATLPTGVSVASSRGKVLF